MTIQDLRERVGRALNQLIDEGAPVLVTSVDQQIYSSVDQGVSPGFVGSSVTAPAGERGSIILSNPAGSGAFAFVEGLMVSTVVAQGAEIKVSAGAFAGVAPIVADDRFSGSSKMRISTDTRAGGAVGNVIGHVRLQADSTIWVPIRWVLGPNRNIFATGFSLATFLSAIYRWREVRDTRYD